MDCWLLPFPSHYSLSRHRQPRFLPRAQSAGHRADILISHLLQTLRHQRGTASAAAITNDRLLHIGNLLFDFQLDHAAAEMRGPSRMALAPIALFPHIDQNRFASFRLSSERQPARSPRCAALLARPVSESDSAAAMREPRMTLAGQRRKTSDLLATASIVLSADCRRK